MGVFSYLKSILPVGRQRRYRNWLTDSSPVFSYNGQNIYLSDFVNNAIDRVASEISKIDVKSIVQAGDAVYSQNDDITRLFRFKPNPLQTTSDFLANVEWLRRKNRNAFIYPQYEIITVNGRQYKRYVAFYPLNPTDVYIGTGDDGRVWEVKLVFGDGTDYTLPYSELIHLKWRRGVNTVVGGGDDQGRANDTDIARTLDALDKTIQGLPKAIEASTQIKGVYHAKSLTDAEKLAKERDNFESHIYSSKSGIVATDLAGDFTAMNITIADIPESVMKFLKAVIQERYGVSAAILSGDYNGEQHSAFYQTAIEEFIVQWEQAWSAGLFTPREQDVGHRIKCYYAKVHYLSTNNKIELAKIATATRLMTLNQINEMFGLEPFEGGNKRLQSLNYVDSEIANQYQINTGKNSKVKDETGKDEDNGQDNDD